MVYQFMFFRVGVHSILGGAFVRISQSLLDAFIVQVRSKWKVEFCSLIMRPKAIEVADIGSAWNFSGTSPYLPQGLARRIISLRGASLSDSANTANDRDFVWLVDR